MKIGIQLIVALMLSVTSMQAFSGTCICRVVELGSSYRICASDRNACRNDCEARYNPAGIHTITYSYSSGTCRKKDEAWENIEKMIKDEETPRMRCLLKCRENLVSCMANAGNDSVKQSECKKKLNTCITSCPAPSSN